MKSINNIFEMVKADRYTADGREEIIKAQEAETKDARRYKTGEISEATGLQKQPDGSWAPPKSTKYGKVTTNKEGKVGIQQTLGKGSKFEEYPDEKSASRALANLTAGYNTTERSKWDPRADKVRLAKHWWKEAEQIKKENKAERRAAHAAQFQNEAGAPAGTKEPPKRESVSAGRMQKDLDGNFWSRPDDFKEDITSRGWDVEEMNNEYAVISNEAGSQYEVRFDDHSDDGDLTVRTFKPLMVDEDDDDELEDAATKVLTGDTKIRVKK